MYVANALAGFSDAFISELTSSKNVNLKFISIQVLSIIKLSLVDSNSNIIYTIR